MANKIITHVYLSEIYEALLKKGLVTSRSNMLERIGISPTNSSKYFSGITNLSSENIAELVNAYGVNANYLLCGIGSIFIENEDIIHHLQKEVYQNTQDIEELKAKRKK